MKKTVLLIIPLLLIGLAWGQDCDEGSVYLWGDCNNYECMEDLEGCLPDGCIVIGHDNEMYLDYCGITGEIPPEIGELTNITILHLEGNQLAGEIPSEIGNLTNLTSLDLSNHNISKEGESIGGLTGSIPSEIGNLTNLTSLSLYSNELTGEIPPGLGNLTNLTSLLLHDNQLTGEIPTEIENLTYMADYIGNNAFMIGSNYLYCVDGEQNTSAIPQSIEAYCQSFTDNAGLFDQNCSSMSITEVLPIHYKLSQPYPNPFNPTTTIQFSLPQSDMVSMKVYDLNGRIIETLLNDFQDVGKHTITWDGSYQSSGMYFVRLESGEFVQTRKVVLIK